ncbi:MAG: hypothetical protein LBI27_03130, partial [Clostridiales bacterium]|nr:hypothetical protein [Clostridiales bacterium]
RPLFNATVVERLSSYNYSGRIETAEFGIGRAFINFSNSEFDFILCNDVFGEYRKFAAEKNLFYIHPTYGTVSRYGLIPVATSMDQIGILCKNPRDGFEVLSKIAGKDEKDGAMFPEEKYDFQKLEKEIKLVKFEDIKLEYFDVCRHVMYILSSAEFSHNINRYDGIKYGYRTPESKGLNELYMKSRSEGLGSDVKFAALVGVTVLSHGRYSAYYEKSMKIRRLIKESLLFDEYDVIILPCTIGKYEYENSALYALANLAGLPSVSFSHKGNTVQLIANVKNENALLTALDKFECDSSMQSKNRSASPEVLT